MDATCRALIAVALRIVLGIAIATCAASSQARADAVPACPPGLQHERGSYHGTGPRCIPNWQQIAMVFGACACPLAFLVMIGLGANRVRSRGE